MTAEDSEDVWFEENRHKILEIDDIPKAFNTEAYLKDFYSEIDEAAMRVVLHYLPSIAARLKIQTDRVLDFGSGPTVHVAAIFRTRAREIFLSDYLKQNREELVRWARNQSGFDWTKVMRVIAMQEGDLEQWRHMENDARRKVRAILACDMHKSVPLAMPNQKRYFDVVTSFFTVEYSCKTEEAYKLAIHNICSLIRPGGCFIYGGVLEERWCGFGGVAFVCLYLTEKLLFESLESANIDTQSDDFIYYLCNGIYLLCGRKRET